MQALYTEGRIAVTLMRLRVGTRQLELEEMIVLRLEGLNRG